ncbi:MAG: ISKra4 family transposase [Planctomycetes bacterium]|nr:ISKra4 family transposase [Planctomycetota bacterium]
MSIAGARGLVKEHWQQQLLGWLRQETAALYDVLVAQEGDFGEQEKAVREWVLAVGARALERFYEVRGHRGHVGPGRACKCGPSGWLQFKDYRRRVVVTLVGELHLVRAYYHCRCCGRGWVPLDEQIGLEGHGFSPGVRRLTSHLGGEVVFGRVARFLAEVGVAVSAKEAERRTEETGRRFEVGQQERIKQVLGDPWPTASASPAPERLYIQVDGTKVHTLKEWREVKLGALFETPRLAGEGGRRRRRTSYCGAIEPAEAFGRRLFTAAVERGALTAGEVVFMGDGAPWLWNLAAEHFPERVEILDWYHASQHLWELGKVLYGEGKARCRSWVESRLQELGEGEVEAVLRAFGRLRPRSEEGREKVRREKAYFKANRERMRYGEFRRQGYFVGSGVVESGCKQAVGHRLKQAGMRWRPENADAVLQVRLAILNGKFDALWAESSAA